MVTLCVLLWARQGCEAELGRYEDQVLALLADHEGRVVQRARAEGGGTGAGEGEGEGPPAEVQILQIASDCALEQYMSDPRRTALAGQRDAAIARTDVLRVELL